MLNKRRVLAGVLAALVAAGCGGGGGTSAKASDTPPSKDAALAAAAAINLKAADMPGYKAEPDDGTDDSDTDAEEKALAACVGVKDVSGADEIVNESSDDFNKGEAPATVTVSSSVAVVKSAKEAKADLEAFQSAKATDCVKTFVGDVFKAQLGETPGVTFSDVAVSQLNPQADGTDGAFGYQVTAKVSAQGFEIPFVISIEGVLKGHTELSLMTFSLGPAISDADRAALLAKLVTRLKASAV